MAERDSRADASAWSSGEFGSESSLSGPEWKARFAIAARHSRMVRVLRVAVPAAVILAMAAIVRCRSSIRSGCCCQAAARHGNLVVSGTKITMESPHMAGYTQDQRPYEVWAKTATQDVTRSRSRRSQDPARQAADGGPVDRHARSSTGGWTTRTSCWTCTIISICILRPAMKAWLSQAFVDMNKNTVTSEEHVDVKLLNGTLTSDSSGSPRGGELIRFEGKCGDGSGQVAARRTRA